MKKASFFRFLPHYLKGNLPKEFKSALKLLEPKARSKYLVLSLLQILLALLEVFALSVLAITTSVALSSYTNIAIGQKDNLGILNIFFPNMDPEGKILILLAIYILLTIAKTVFSAIVTSAALALLAKQSAIVGFRLNNFLYSRGVNKIRFGKSQENLSGVTNSLDSLLISYLGTVSQLSGDIATMTIVCVAMMFLDIESTLMLISLFSLLIWILHRFINTSAAKLGERVAVSSTQLNRKILDSWLVYRELLLAQKVEKLLQLTLANRIEIAKSRARLSFLPSLSKYIFELFIVLSALALSAFQIWRNGISEAVNSFILVVAASSRLLPAVLRLQGNLIAIKQSIGGSYYARKILSDINYTEYDLISVDSASNPTMEFHASVTVDKLNFTYPDSSEPALNDITFSITPGSFTAITGPSGSGKTTLVDLVLGFLEPTSGSVLVNDLDPMKVQKIWPGKISYVPQDVQIFEGSIAENIALGSEREYDKDLLQECLQLSGLINDISSLAEGVDTLVGERGLKLSGGQKQRLGIARALYSKPELIVFDEATSSLDPITENQIARNVYHNLSNRTVIVIAHRLSTVMRADMVLYFKEGRLIASGTFENLKQSVPEFLEQAELSGL
jgi:ABC-type multidrug transport system fused ATPase/permease subunit